MFFYIFMRIKFNRMKKGTLLFFLFLSIKTFTQEYHVKLDYFLPKNISYNQDIPTPASVIDHEIGDWHITHDKLVQYMYALAESSDRISIENRGRTFEGRPLLLLYISAPNNLSNLEKIRENHIALTENGSDNIEVTKMPIVVYQGFSIHGNEPSGSNAALAVAYYLAAAQGSEIENLLNETVILFDPSYNPDGLQRFAYWANINKSKNINPDPNDREYSEIWPGGRTNHYWFDMNRDWLPVQLPESQARINTFHNWYPNILTDHHEMGTNSTFFFQPGIPSRTNPLTPSKNQEITEAIGKFHAKALNKIGSFYYSKESFDDFYYGKGSTFPDINGGIGILFEQASSRGHAQESDNGILTFPFTIRNQFTAALSTLEAALSMRIELLNYQKSFYANARKEAKNSGVIVFGDEKDATKVNQLAKILKLHKIEYYELKSNFSKNGKNYKKGYSYVIPKDQKQHRLINAMFQKRTTFQDSLGVDVVNTSLGYRGFDNSNYDHTYEDLDGQTTFSARGANIAFDKGMILVTSAGNGGNTSFPTVGTPGDSPGTLTVGAVNSNGIYVAFSSIGPTVDGRVKPDVMAQGSNAAVINTGGNIDFSSGTSFSSPIMAGVITCLWQSRPDVPNGHIMQIVRESANLYNNPTDQMGYGIPNFENAYVALQELGLEDDFLMSNFALYPNPVTSKINISFPEGISNGTFTIYSILGNKVLSTEISRNLNSVNMESLNSGMYIASINSNNKQISFKIIKE